MEQLRSAKAASLVLQDQHSTASLAANAPPPAGSRFSDPDAPCSAPADFAEPYPATDSDTDQDRHQLPTTTTRLSFYKSRIFIISHLILVVVLLFILLFPVVRAIAQLIVNKSYLNIDVAAISHIQNNTFQLALQGTVSHTGIFPAQIHFTEPANVTWIEHDNTETPLGYMSLSTISARNKHAIINQTTAFIVTDQDAFGRFAANMITALNFTWRLTSTSLRVQALKFPVSNGIKFSKDIMLKGANSFAGNVILEDLQLPSENPLGGINFVALVQLINPSPFSLDLGTVVFALSYNNTFLGSGTAVNTKIVHGPNLIKLSGYLQRQDSAVDLAAVSQLFTNYINGDSSSVIATGQSTILDDNSTVSWLTRGLQALKLTVPFKPAAPINPIKAISIGEFDLAFSASAPWAPQVKSNTVKAALQLPFGFGISIGKIRNDFNIVKDGASVAGLSTTLGASTSRIIVYGNANTSGTIDITIDTALTCTDQNHARFSSFNANLTNLPQVNFELVGNSFAVANTSIGQVTLNPIKVNVSSSLHGLQGLKGLTTIKSVDVLGGSASAIQLSISVAIFNPSNLKLATGDLTLQFFREGAVLGTVLLPNLTLEIGNNTLNASSQFMPNNNAQGQQTLDDFVGKKDVALNITGYNGSTQIVSLLQAFESLSIGVALPGLKQDLLSTAALEVLPTTGRQNNISQVTVDLVNPFTAALDIIHIVSVVSYRGIRLGTIDAGISFSALGKSTTKSPTLDLDMNLDPAALFTITRVLAIEAGLDVSPLDAIVKIGGLQYLPLVQPDGGGSVRRGDQFSGFNLPTFVDTAFKKLQSDVEISVDVLIGAYKTALNYTQMGVPIFTDSSLNLILPVLAQPIVQKLVSGSVLSIDTVLITNPQQNSFDTTLKGAITEAGPFDATISFKSGLTVSWSGKPIGTLKMGDVKLIGDVGATILIESAFMVADVDHLAEFTKTLLTEESFDWVITGDNLTVTALGIDVPGVSLPAKTVTLKGFNGLKGGVMIKSFDLPSNDPAGGIHLTIQATVVNPSQVGVELSSIGFRAYVGGVMIAIVVSQGAITLAPESTSPLFLVGRLVPQTSPEGLVVVSTIFNNFIHGEDSDIDIHGTSAGSGDVTWLTEGIQSLQIATILPNQGKLNLMKSITLNELKLVFTQGSAYSPLTSSDSTTAVFSLPFAFPVDVTALEQNITIGFQGQSLALLALPKAATKTDVEKRIITLTFNDIPLSVFSDQHDTFDSFVAAVTIDNIQTVHLSGAANGDAQTAVGLLSLLDIEFSMDSTIQGLQGLDANPVTVSALDVKHGYSDYLLITVFTGLYNPSNLTIGTGDVTFALQFQGQTIGSADLSNLIITPGKASYATDVHYAPHGGAMTAGTALLQNFLQGVESTTTISGSSDSTSIRSLKSALSQIRLSPIVIPSLHQNLITSASLTFPIDIVKTGIASVSFSLSNPFTASINLLQVVAIATFHGLKLGYVNVSSSPIHADGHSNITSPEMPLKFNLDPLTIIQLLSITAQQKDVDLGPLLQLFQTILGKPLANNSIITTVDNSVSTCVSGRQFDVNSAILKALSGILVDLAVDSSVKLDDYTTELAFNQLRVPVIIDDTALYLIGAVAAPIAQTLVDGASLVFTEANITNISEGGFDLSLHGSLTDVGPLDALITFVEPVTVTWQGQNIATIALLPVCVAANSGVPDYRSNAHLAITDLPQFTLFATFLLHNPSFDWTISTPKLRVTALGTIFDNVALSKKVSFKAFNGLPGVTINDFKLPSDDPAGGVRIETVALIPSSSQLGIDLGTVAFQAYFKNTLVGPLSTSHLFLAADSTTRTQLSGLIVPQSSPELDEIGTLFSQFLVGANPTLIAKGESVLPPGCSQPVAWLSSAFKTLSLDVILPGQKLQVIRSITLSDLNVTMETQDQAFAPLSSSTHTLVQYKNPFGFSLQVIEAAEDIVLSSGGINIAELKLARSSVNGGVSTGNLADLEMPFRDQTLRSLNDGAFRSMFAAVTLQRSVFLDLKGTANVTARTTIGDVPITRIPFDVSSDLKGIDGLEGTAFLSNVSVAGSGGTGGNEYIVSPLTATLQNPSGIALRTVDIALPVIFDNVQLGHAVISPFDLQPGENVIHAEFHYQPQDANDTSAQGFLSSFIQGNQPIPLTIKGDSASTPFSSLQPALEGLHLSTSLAAMDVPPLITHITVSITLDSLTTNLVSVNFDFVNPLPVDIVIQFVQSDASIHGENYAHFDQMFSSFMVPAGKQVNSGDFPNVLLTKGAMASLDIISLGYLDISAASTVLVGEGGYQIPWLHLEQKHVPTNYNLALDSISALAAAINTTSNSIDTSPSSKSGVNSHSLNSETSSAYTQLPTSAVKTTSSPVESSSVFTS